MELARGDRGGQPSRLKADAPAVLTVGLRLIYQGLEEQSARLTHIIAISAKC